MHFPHKSEVKIEFDSIDEAWNFLHFVVDRIRDEKTEFFVNVARAYSSDAIGNAEAFEKLIGLQGQIVAIIADFEKRNGPIKRGLPKLYPHLEDNV